MVSHLWPINTSDEKIPPGLSEFEDRQRLLQGFCCCSLFREFSKGRLNVSAIVSW